MTGQAQMATCVALLAGGGTLKAPAFTLAEGATHVAMLNSQRRFGFTLAEVLVTLGIIGVVAAMTMPVITSIIEKNVLKSQIKKTYSTLSQVQQKLLYEFDSVLTDSTDVFGYKAFNTAVIESLKIGKVCKGNALASGCVPKYQGLNIISCPAFNENAVYNIQTVYILSDGSILIPYHMDWRSLWLVDVNGMKGPNKAGYDLFDVAYDRANKRLEMRGRGCLNQDGAVKGGLDDFKNIDKW
ncbi:MAG: hypothetical protein BHW55_05100 [Candidatus Melainabacteria bacterium 35_41]|nr:MAG: hypothetical protein BHW55_05100 [Candidatus Melainabacteria bacterium 35_41]